MKTNNLPVYEKPQVNLFLVEAESLFHNSIQKSSANEMNTEECGTNIRTQIQAYNSGRSGIEELFYGRFLDAEFIGIEFAGCIFYLHPVSKERTMFIIFDKDITSLLEVLSKYDAIQTHIISRYTPRLFTAIENANNPQTSNSVMMCYDGKWAIFAQTFDFNLVQEMSSGNMDIAKMIHNIVNIINYRNQCIDEFGNFKGFSEKEQNEILLYRTSDTIKKGIKLVRFVDFISSLV